MRGFCGAPSKVTDLIVSHVYCDCFPGLSSVPRVLCSCALATLSLSWCLIFCCPSPQGAPSPPCSFLLLPGT